MNNSRTLTMVAILVVVLGLIGWLLVARGILPGRSNNEKLSGWQAVFLTNGQVYFGKLSDRNSRYLTLRDIYYLQLAQAPQPAEGQNSNQQSQVSLVKLGNELHGPADEMKINRDHVLFIEDMKDNAKVVDAIKRYMKNGPTQSNNSTVSPSPLATPSS